MTWVVSPEVGAGLAVVLLLAVLLVAWVVVCAWRERRRESRANALWDEYARRGLL